MIVSLPAVKIASHKMKHTKHYVYLSLSLFPAVTVEFDPTSYTVSESDRYANITVVKRGQTTQTVSVNFNTADGNAIGKSSLCVYMCKANSRVPYVLHFMSHHHMQTSPCFCNACRVKKPHLNF